MCFEYGIEEEKPRSWKAHRRMLFLLIFLYIRILLSSQILSGILMKSNK